MPALLGRKVRIQRSADGSDPWTTIAGARSDSITFNRGEVDITDKDDDGIRTLLGDVALVSVDMSVEGVFFDETLITDALNANTALFNFRISIEGVGTVTGTWFLSNVEIGAPHDNATTFSARIMSSGAVVWAAAP